jgi:mono/diheme cytochrome c family protein
VPRPLRRHSWIAGALACALGLGALTGCGGSGPEDTAANATVGKQLFTQQCGACHVLNDAGTKGQIGPNLDDAFKQSIADGLGRDTIEGVVREQIALPEGGQMPANLVTGKDADDVSAYVASVVGKGGPAGTPAATGGGGGTAKANAKDEVSIPADPTGQLAYEFKSATAKAGNVTLLSKNDAPIPHDISVKGGGVDEQGEQVTGGGVSKVSVELKPGKYTFYCSVPGHEQGGMKGDLTVK